MPEITFAYGTLFQPLVSDARGRLRSMVQGGGYELLTAEAHAGWERYLHKRLSEAGAKAADSQFQLFRTVHAAFSPGLVEGRYKEESIRRSFVGNHPGERTKKIFAEFPKLRELCHTLVENWIGTVSEFLERLRNDLAELPNRFQNQGLRGPIVTLQAGLSDPHHGGRCVVRLGFVGGATLIYKPRSVAPEVHFSRLIGNLNFSDIPYSLRSARCWDRGSYGWTEDIRSSSCESLAGVEAFYWRAGALLALIYLAYGVDMHRENLVAVGEYPVLIDLETLWHPQEHVDVEKNLWVGSVLRTGFLPQDQPSIGETYELGGLSRRVQQGSNKSSAVCHLPVFEGVPHPASPFLPNVLAGFDWVGQRVFDDQGEGQSIQRMLLEFRECPRRRVVRSTAEYRAAINWLISPRSLRTRSGVSEALPENFAFEGPPLIESEWQALRDLDLPYVKQADVSDDERNSSLPVQSLEEFRMQSSFISTALSSGSEPQRPTN